MGGIRPQGSPRLEGFIFVVGLKMNVNSTETLLKEAIVDAGEAVFTVLLSRRKEKTPVTMKGPDGRSYSSDNPGWLDAAIILADVFCPVDAWANSTSILALIQTAISDLNKAIKLEEDGSRISSLNELRLKLEDFLKRNSLTVPE